MIDHVEIKVRAGDGGNGAVSFRREMYVPYGGPDGGDGGKGGSVIFRADRSVDSLRAYRGRTHYNAENGHAGMGKKKSGKDGADFILGVPEGTIITATDEDGSQIILADLGSDGEQVIVAAGGKGGFGNVHFKSSVNQAPRLAQKGEAGEATDIRLEMRLIADVGIIGYPNAGKSTLMAAASAARPKVAPYPFTTLEPVLGVVQIGDNESFVLAEIPGLIEGAHAGKGLGIDFLRHAMRTKIIIHLISGESDNPGEDMIKVNNELAMFDMTLAKKPQIVAINKVDIPEVQEKLAELKADLAGAGIKAQYISAATGQGVPALMAAAYKILQSETEAAKPTEPSEKVFRPSPKEPKVRVVKEDDEFVIYTPGLDRLYGGSGSTMNELRWQLNTQLEKMGVNKILEKAGVKKGDKIRCGDLTWEWLSTKHEGRKIGILGGTFDPVHSGHVMMAQEAVATLGLEELLIIPAGQPVYKTTAAITPAQQRLEMLQLAINGIPGLKISTIEIDRPGPSYTVDTIAAVRKLYKPGDEMYFVLGWDSLERVPDWKEPSKLINLCTLVAVPRPGYTKPGMRKLEGVLPGITKKVIFIDKPKVEISSTAIREMVEKGESIDHLVPKAVAEYIKKHHLYFGQ